MRWTFTAIAATLTLAASSGASAEGRQEFTDEELSVAEFWRQMGPVLMEQGIAAYAIRYHEDFRHWNIQGNGGFSGKQSVVDVFTKFLADGHKITCTHVEPVTIDIVGDSAIARLLYEQTDVYADGTKFTGAWRMVDVFQRFGDTWQVLESNMVRIASSDSASDDDSDYEFHCPQEQ